MSNIVAENYELLIRKLDEFIRKFYTNQLIRGAIYFFTVILASFLLVDVLEYFFYFNSVTRTFLLAGFILAILLLGLIWLVLPALHYMRLGKIISHEQAAGIIGSHFREVQDRLLSVLQLRKLTDASDNSLIQASINQKIASLKPVPFSRAINLRVNRKYLRYLMLPILALAFILFAAPNLITESTNRLLHPEEKFEREAPFQFLITNQKLQTIQYRDFTLHVKTDGHLLPNEMFISINGFSFPLVKDKSDEFEYTFSKPNDDVKFYLNAGGFNSKDYSLEVIPKPAIIRFQTQLNYPPYTGKKNETQQNLGDMTIPEGTEVNWLFQSQHVSDIDMAFADSNYNAKESSEDQFSFNRKFKTDNPYKIVISGPNLPNGDSIRYNVTVIPDRYPSININALSDSTNKRIQYFVGEASDDYGLKNIDLKYLIKSEGTADDPKAAFKNVPISFQQGKDAQFSYIMQIDSFHLNPGDEVNYYFEAWDNDGVNGSKSSRTQMMTYRMATREEMNDQIDSNNTAIKGDLQSTMKSAGDLQQQAQKLQEQLFQKKNLGYEDQKKLQDLQQEQKELAQKLDEIQKKFEQNMNNQQGYKNYDQQLQQKQDELKQLFDQTLTPQMQQLMQKISDLLNQLNKNDVLENLKQTQLNSQQLQQNLDRLLSLFKQLEFEQKANDAMQQLDSLAKKQDSLQQKTEENKNKSENEKLNQQQKDLQDQFNKTEQNLDSLQQFSKQLDHQTDLPNTQQQQQQINQNMQQAQQQLQNNNNKSASQQQQQASQNLKNLSQKIQNSMQGMQMQQMQMDMASLRMILKNLLKVSFDQENLIGKSKAANIYNPQYLQNMKDQHDLVDNMQMVEDSLQELGKRMFELQSFISEKTATVDKNMSDAVSQLEQRQPAQAASSQQFAMTNVNDLALMLEEQMQQMQQQMAIAMPGAHMCQKPGQGNSNGSGLDKLGQQQQQLNDKITQFGQQHNNPSNSPGGNKQGDNESESQSEQLARLSQQQAAIREMLNSINNQLNKDGKNSLGNLDQIMQQMEKTETDLVNKNVTDETMKRQQDILKHLLEAENAEKQRETDNRRSSTPGKDMVKKVPPEMEDYLQKKQAELELFKTVPPELTPFYRNLVEEYFKSLQH